MASLGSHVTLAGTPAPLHVARAWPWRVDDLSDQSLGPSLPRLRAQCNGSFVASGRRVSSPEPHGTMQLEIDADDARVVSLVHAASHIVDRVFRFPAPVLDAALVQFPLRERARKNARRRRDDRHRRRRTRHDSDDKQQQQQQFTVCILSRSDCVHVYAPDGESHEVTLPFHADRIVALAPIVGGGLLLQRRPLTPAPSAAATVAVFSPSHARSPPGTMQRSAPVHAPPVARPRYFTLAHPLEEVKPMALASARGSTASGAQRSASYARQQRQLKTLAFLSDPALELVSVCPLPASQERRDDDNLGDERQHQRALMVFYHRLERRFVVYEMAHHVHEPGPSASSEDSGSGMFSLANTTMPTTPNAQAVSFVSPAKARQHEREVAMMEQYFKSHIVPKYCARLVWTSPNLDAIAESHGAASSRTARTSISSHHLHQRAFLVAGSDDDAGDDGYSTSDEITCRLGIVDEHTGVFLLKPVRGSASEDENELFQDRENDLHVIRCQSASPLVQPQKETSKAVVATELVLSNRDGTKLYLYGAGHVIGEVILPDRGARSDPIRLYKGSQLSGNILVGVAARHGRTEWRQYHHPLSIERSSLLRSVMEVLRYVLTTHDYVKIHVATLALASARYSMQPTRPRIEYTEDDQWWAFRSVMRVTISKMVGSTDEESLEHGAPKKARATRHPESPARDEFDLVSRVMMSEFATAYENHHSAVLAAVSDLHTFPSTSRIKEDQHLSFDGIEMSPETVGRVLTALHLLHEDHRLSIARNQAAVFLAHLIHELCVTAGMHQLASYYSCQYRSIAPVGALHLPVTSPQVEIPLFFDDDGAVPDVNLWLREKLQGSSSSGRSMVGGGSFEQVTTHVSSSGFPRLQGINDWKRALHESKSLYPLWRTEVVCRVYELLFPDEDDDDGMKGNRGYDISRLTELMDVLTSDEVGCRLSLDDLPVGIRFVLLEAIRVYREDPPHHVSELVCEFIGRRDLAATYSSSGDHLSNPVGSLTSGSLVESTRLKSGGREPNSDTDLNAKAGAREVPDGLSDVVIRSQRLFPSDQRLKEVARLLRSNRPLSLRLEKSSDMTDQDFVAQQQARLLLLCKRSMALSVARGMVTLGTFDMTTVQNQAWQLTVPALPLAGRTPPTNATVLLDVSGYAKELTHWPQFHNGCATGLRLPGKDLSSIVTRYWIKYHRPSASEFQRVATQGARSSQPSSTATARDIDEAHAAHAGVLLGLGLNGHLKCLSMADVYNYLSISNEFVTVAILLGMATTAARSRRKRLSSSSAALQAARRRRRRERFLGTAPDVATQDDGQLPTASQVADADVDMDANVPASAAQDAPPDDESNKTPIPAGAGVEHSLERSVSKMLCLHIPALLPPAFAEFSVPASTQTAALLGLGILYQGSGNRLMTELLLTEITRSPASPQFVSSQHSTASSSSTSSTTQFDQHEGYSLAAGLGLGLVLLGRGGATTGDPGLADLGLEEKLYKYIVGGATQPFPAGGGDANASGSYLYRGRKWKPFGSGLSGSMRPGGANGSSSNANRSGNPVKNGSDRSLWRGEHVNIGVTACGSALALAFLYIKSGNRSIASQLAVPDTLILLDYVRPDILMIRTLAKNLILWDSIEPTTAWVERSEVPLQLREAYKLLQNQGGESDAAASLPDHADVRSICESYANIVAGACFSMGLRFAGTGDGSARETLRRFVVFFRDMRSRSALLGIDITTAATERVTIERCLSVCAQALALVDAGTGNLETLTLLRSINLRQRVDNELTYGNHMALSMAMGLLFLGGGRATVSRSNDAIAALVVSLYPVTAMNTADNKYHLQAFRHLYTLAVDGSRHVETIDTTSGEPCSVELQVESHREGPNGTLVKTTATLKTPCLMPEIDSMDRIVINTPGFYPVDIRLQDQGDDDGDGDAWGFGRAMDGTRGVRTTANDNRIKLLLERSQILLERRMDTPQRSMISVSPLSQESVGTHNGDGMQALQAYHQYFPTTIASRTAHDQVGDDGASAWWRQRLAGNRVALLASPVSQLPSHLSVLFEVFSMHHPRRPLASLAGLWNLKLIHEFHRIDPFRSLEYRQPIGINPGEKVNGASEDVDAGKRDFVEWLQGQTEEALRHRWRLEASTSFPSLSAVQQALVDHGRHHRHRYHPLSMTVSENDMLLLSALFVLFDAPPSVVNNPSDWKRRVLRAMAVASNASSSARSSSASNALSSFAVDRFLQPHAHDDHMTKEEQTFWLRVVTCFLFSV